MSGLADAVVGTSVEVEIGSVRGVVAAGDGVSFG
jgi:hypothetical protein